MITFVKNEAISSQIPVSQTKINMPMTEKDKMKKKLI